RRAVQESGGRGARRPFRRGDRGPARSVGFRLQRSACAAGRRSAEAVQSPGVQAPHHAQTLTPKQEQLMTIICTITLDDARDDFNEKQLTIDAPPRIPVRQNTNGAQWRIINNSGAVETVKIRNFQNLTSPGNPADPCTDVTSRRKILVLANGGVGIIEVNVA